MGEQINVNESNNWNICGHEKVIEFLKGSINNNRTAHAYLFVGLKHLGKYTVAKSFVSSLLCQQESGPNYCQNCYNCQQFEKNIHPDVYMVEQKMDEKTGKLKRGIVIGQVRELKNKLQQATLLDGYKVALIPEAQLINKNAANAVLKVLEEPTPNTIIILIAEDIKQLPDTIVSRCQVLKFLPVATREVQEYLQAQGVDPEQGNSLSRLAQGKPGRAITFLDNQELLNQYKGNVDSFLRVLGCDIGGRLGLVDGLVKWDKDEFLNITNINVLFNDWQVVLRDLLLISTDNEPLIVNLDYLNQLKIKHQELSVSKIKNIWQNIQRARGYFQDNVNSKLVLENLIINI